MQKRGLACLVIIAIALAVSILLLAAAHADAQIDQQSAASRIDPILAATTNNQPNTRPPEPPRPIVAYSVKNDTSPALRDMQIVSPQFSAPDGTIREIPHRPLPKFRLAAGVRLTGEPDGAVQIQPAVQSMTPTLQNFEGINNVNGVLPPDTQGDIGTDPVTGRKYFVQWVNLSYAIWDVTAVTPTLVLNPTPGNRLWQGFGGDCETHNDGDPITLYDASAHRWLMTQFALSNRYSQCIAVSKTGDPTDPWYRYAFEWLGGNGAPVMNDYPKFGVWPDAYYMSVNQFDGSDPACVGAWCGAGVAAFERKKMLNGQPARMVSFDLLHVDSNFGGMLPADLDGPLLPPPGSPNTFAEVDDSGSTPSLGPVDAMRLWKFHVDWANPLSSTFGIGGLPNHTLPVTAFTSLTNQIPQPNTTQTLDTLADRLMYRLAYRNFGDHESLVVNHTVDAGTGRAGVRWYEVRDPGGSPIIYQQGTYAPADALHRWMGSIAQDHQGNMALGYSVSSNSVYPSIRYTGRLVSDTLDQMPQGEAILVNGSGSQLDSRGRWGDYSTMTIDPADDCTFWFTNEYMAATSPAGWQTRIASFKFPSCHMPTGTLIGTVYNSTTSNPITTAVLIEATLGPTYTASTVDGSNGVYSLPLVGGVYTVTAAAYGYLPATVNNVAVDAGVTTTQNIALTPLVSRIVSGTVTDARAGWPLYAHLTITGDPIDPPAPYNRVWTDPVTGHYSITLAEGITYTLNVGAGVSGYLPGSRVVSVTADSIQDFALDADAVACNAPGYTLKNGLRDDFNAASIPAGWNVVNNIGSAGWRFDNPGGRLNFTGGTGHIAIADSDKAGTVAMNTELRTPPVNLAALNQVTMTFKTDFHWYALGGNEVADVDVSNTGGAAWANAWRKSGADYRGPATENINITALAAGQDNVMVRFHYYNASFDWWWEVDDFQIGSPTCDLQAGGLVVGSVHDKNTNAALAGASVSNDSGGSAMTTTAPDLTVDNSLYTLFSPAGAHVFTATMNLYQPAVMTATVVQSSTLRQDFYLSTGPDLAISKSGPATARAGDVITYTIRYTNMGDETALGTSISDTLPVSVTALVPTAWSVGSVAPGFSGTIVLTATPDSELAIGTTLINTVSIAASNAEVITANNIARWALLINRPFYLPFVTSSYP